MNVCGKLNKAATPKMMANGDCLFLVNIGDRQYDRQTKEKIWVNYSAAVFAKSSQLDHYTKALSQGSIVSIAGTGVIPRIWGDNRDKITLDIVDAKVVYANYDSIQQAQAPQQQQVPQQSAAGFDDFSDDIPF